MLGQRGSVDSSEREDLRGWLALQEVLGTAEPPARSRHRDPAGRGDRDRVPRRQCGVGRDTHGDTGFVQGSARVVRNGTVNTLPFPTDDRRGRSDRRVRGLGQHLADDHRRQSRRHRYRVAVSRTTWGSGWSAATLFAKNIAGGPDTVTATYSTGDHVVRSDLHPRVLRCRVVNSSSTSGRRQRARDPRCRAANATTKNAKTSFSAAAPSNDTVTGSGSGFHPRSTAFANLTEDRAVTSTGSYSKRPATQNSNAWVMQIDRVQGGHDSPSSGTRFDRDEARTPPESTCELPCRRRPVRRWRCRRRRGRPCR